jgi:hypothetical protein
VGDIPKIRHPDFDHGHDSSDSHLPLLCIILVCRCLALAFGISFFQRLFQYGNCSGVVAESFLGFVGRLSEVEIDRRRLGRFRRMRWQELEKVLHNQH